MVTTIFITLSSFSFIRISIATFFLWLILGNILVRIAYEFVLMFLTLVGNTSDINKKMGPLKKETEKAVKTKKTERNEE